MGKKLSDADEAELQAMAEKLLRKEEKSKIRLKLLGERIKSGFKGFGHAEFMLVFSAVVILGMCAIPTIFGDHRKGNKSVVVEIQTEYDYKHWANVLMIIHPKDAKRTAEIIAEVDKPHQLIDFHFPFEEFDGRCYLVTRELEQILKDKGIRYKREQYATKELEDLFDDSYKEAKIAHMSKIKPWINW